MIAAGREHMLRWGNFLPDSGESLCCRFPLFPVTPDVHFHSALRAGRRLGIREANGLLEIAVVLQLCYAIVRCIFFQKGVCGGFYEGVAGFAQIGLGALGVEIQGLIEKLHRIGPLPVLQRQPAALEKAIDSNAAFHFHRPVHLHLAGDLHGALHLDSALDLLHHLLNTGLVVLHTAGVALKDAAGLCHQSAAANFTL